MFTYFLLFIALPSLIILTIYFWLKVRGRFRMLFHALKLKSAHIELLKSNLTDFCTESFNDGYKTGYQDAIETRIGHLKR